MSTRLYACLFTLLSVAFGVAHAVPARPLYLPPEPLKLPATVTVNDTTWSGHLYIDNEHVTFHADGTLTYTHGQPGAVGGGSPGNWKLTGTRLWFQINNWSEFETIISGDTIQGPGTNKGGQKTQALMRRVGAAPAKMMPRQGLRAR